MDDGLHYQLTMRNRIYSSMQTARTEGRKQLAVLVDPDKTDHLDLLLEGANKNLIDYFFVGGSLLTDGSLHQCVEKIKKNCSVPVVLFPGHVTQVEPAADALLLLSVISGRNADLLIGRHVLSAPQLKSSGLELISTGYMLIESGAMTTAAYMSNTQPIPRNKNEIAAATALAGEQLGLKLIYLEAGSGAENPVPAAMIKAVRNTVGIPLLAGGGIRTPEEAAAAGAAGADVIVIGNILEQQPQILASISAAVKSCVNSIA